MNTGNTSKSNRGLLALAAFTALLLATLACGIGGNGEQENPALATANALAIQVAQTSTAAAQNPGQDSSSSVATAQARGTEQALAAAQTAQALDSLSAAVTLDIEGYLQYDYANIYLGTVVEDFVISADITWNTQFGTSGCGFALRNNGDQEAFDQYLAIATRGGSGRVEFAIMADGEILNAKDFYAYGLDDNFDWRNDTTNRMTIVMRGPIVQIFTNDTLIAEFDVNEPPTQPYIPPAPTPPPDAESNPDAMAAYEAAKAEYDATVAQINAEFRERQQTFQETDVEFEKGFVAMVVLSESGRTICQFDNAWLFHIEE